MFDFSGQWSTVWSTLTGQWDGLDGLLIMVGFLIVLGAIVTWVWQRRRNMGGGNNGGLIGALVVGMLFLAPNLIIPVTLWAVDGIANFVYNIITNAAGI